MLTGTQLIGYQEINPNTTTFQAVDPVSGEGLPVHFSEASETEVDRAVQLAQAAFPAYKKTTPAQRAAFLEGIAEQIMALGHSLIERCMAETALPQARLEGERARTCNQLRLFAQVVREGSWVDARIDPAMPDRQPLPRPDIRSVRVGIGPVAVFGASNFPLAFSVAGGDTASALAAGCPVVVKAHPAHPGTSEWVGRAILAAAKAAGMPEGVFSLVQGRTFAPGMALVKHPLIQAVGFTGSFKGGKALYDAAQQRPEPIPVYAEMGSTNPVFFLPGALAEKADQLAADLAGSITLGVGQFCTNPGVFTCLQSTDSERFISKVAERLAQTTGGTMLTAGIREAYQKGIGELSQKAELAAQGQRPNSANAVAASLLRAPLKSAFHDPALTEEVFGPSSVALVADDRAELLRFAQQLSGHLTATIWGTAQDLADYVDLVEILENKVGRLIFNGFPTGVEVCHAMVHGGPFPATTDARSTSVGPAAIQRFARPVCYQGFPDAALPPALQAANPLQIWRLVDGVWGK